MVIQVPPGPPLQQMPRLPLCGQGTELQSPEPQHRPIPMEGPILQRLGCYTVLYNWRLGVCNRSEETL